MSLATLPTSASASRADMPVTLIIGAGHSLSVSAVATLAERGLTATVQGDELAARRDAAPDVVLLLSDAPVRDRIAEIEAAARTHGKLPVLAVMPAVSTGAALRKALQAGAAGILLDDQLPALGPAVLAVAAGLLVGPPTLARRLAPRALSHRERQILGLVVRGYTNRQIAGELFVAESTVKSHLSSALRKLDARSRAEAAALILDPEAGYGPAILEADGLASEREMGRK